MSRMEKEWNFETEKYKFWFYQGKTFEDLKVVLVDIKTVSRRDFTDEDLNELKGFFKDMGKWENFVKAGKGLLEDLGISTKAKKKHEEFGHEKYEVRLEKEKGREDRVLVRIALTSEGSARRTGGDRVLAKLPLEEIIEQVKNVPKWQTLTKAFLELKRKL